jgi:hypothetical protein
VLGSEAVRPEFQLLCDRLLTALHTRVGAGTATNSSSKNHNSSNSSSSNSKVAEAEACLAELLELIGFYALECSKNQDTLHWGPAPTLLMRLCNLPFRYVITVCRLHALVYGNI